MPQQNLIHIDQALTNVSLAYRNDEYVAQRVMPRLPVQKRTDKYFVYNKEHLRVKESRVRPGAVAEEFEYTITTGSYDAERRARRHFVSDDEIKMQDVPLNAESDATESLSDLINLIYENDIAAYVTNTSNVTNNTTLSGTSQWSDYVNSTPLTNLKTAKASVRLNALKPANTVVIPYESALVLADHPSIKDLIKYTDPKALTDSGLPPVIRGLTVIEPTAGDLSSVEGRTDTLATVWGKNALVLYVYPGTLGRRTLSFGATFEAADPITGAMGVTTRQYRDDPRGGVWVETAYTYDFKVLSTGAGYLFATCIA